MKIWVHIAGRQLGPYAPEELPLDEMDAGTPVWYDGLPRWTPAGEAPATAQYFLPPAPETSDAPDAPVDNVATHSDDNVGTHPGASAQEVLDGLGEHKETPRRPAPRPTETPKCPPTYLVWSILLTLCCCNPLGIIPIITGAQVSSRYNNMDFEGARRASRNTEWWVIICLVLGLMMLPFNILIYL